MKALRRLALASLAIPLALAAWAFWLEPASLRNESYSLAPPRWPSACDGLRIAVLADLHVGSPWNDLAKLDEILELTRRAQPDLVLLAGDFVIQGVLGGSFVEPEQTARHVARLEPPLGTWAVLGNHDWWLGADRVRAAFESVGIEVLEDRSTPIERGACRLSLAGISDFTEGPHDVRRALAAVPEGSALIAFTHNPDVFPEIPARVNLTIAGHTHGGQVHLPGLGRPIVPSRYGERFALGHIVEGGRHLFVSTGLGTSILPVRFRVPPEVSVLTLRSPGSGEE